MRRAGRPVPSAAGRGRTRRRGRPSVGRLCPDARGAAFCPRQATPADRGPLGPDRRTGGPRPLVDRNALQLRGLLASVAGRHRLHVLFDPSVATYAPGSGRPGRGRPRTYGAVDGGGSLLAHGWVRGLGVLVGR